MKQPATKSESNGRQATGNTYDPTIVLMEMIETDERFQKDLTRMIMKYEHQLSIETKTETEKFIQFETRLALNKARKDLETINESLDELRKELEMTRSMSSTT